ncbi:Hpt domain-containing protein [Marinicella sp. W31]|uniref:Hpt domain-containing protein n=1 Tax=Marinicella sp. W31 TaxID=3023713 RepID=UPI00375648CC
MFEALKNNYKASFTEKIQLLEDALKQNGTQELFKHVHRLTGSSGSYGFMDIYACAQALEDKIINSQNITDELITGTEELINLLQKNKA